MEFLLIVLQFCITNFQKLHTHNKNIVRNNTYKYKRNNNNSNNTNILIIITTTNYNKCNKNNLNKLH